MTTTALDRRELTEQITARARGVKPGAFMLDVLASVLMCIGFMTAKVFGVLFLSFAWSATAVRVGYERANGPTRAQQLALLTAEVDRLRKENDRLGG